MVSAIPKTELPPSTLGGRNKK
jgi:ABC-type multidrug transport system ATPase subunit